MMFIGQPPDTRRLTPEDAATIRANLLTYKKRPAQQVIGLLLEEIDLLWKTSTGPAPEGSTRDDAWRELQVERTAVFIREFEEPPSRFCRCLDCVALAREWEHALALHLVGQWEGPDGAAY